MFEPAHPNLQARSLRHHRRYRSRFRQLLSGLAVIALLGLPALAQAEERAARPQPAPSLDAATRVVVALAAGVRLDHALVAARATTTDEPVIGIELTDGDDILVVLAGEEVMASSDTGEAIGVAALAGNDQVTNQGTIQSTSAVVVDASDLSASADALATGISGGEGDDMLLNEGSIGVDAFAQAVSRSDVIDIDATASSTASAYAFGLTTEGDNSTIHNRGQIDVDANGRAVALAESYSTGDANAFAGAISDVFAAGIQTGAGTATVINDGVIDVSGNSRATGQGWADPGASSYGHAKSDTDATALALGIYANDGGATLTNSAQGTINVVAVASAYGVVISTEYTTVGGSTDDPWSNSEATALGIFAREGDNRLTNAGNLHVAAKSTADAKALSDSAEYDTRTKTFVHAEAVAVGMDSGQGSAEIVNEGLLTVDAISMAKANRSDSQVNNPRSDSIDDAWADSGADSEARAIGITTSAGQALVVNSGDVYVTAKAHSEAYTRADSGPAGDDLAKSESAAEADAAGILVAGSEDEVTRVENRGLLDVLAGADAWTYARGDERSDASSFAKADAAGIVVYNGDAEIVNSGEVRVKTTALAEATYVDDGGALERTGSSCAAISTSEGNDTITNSGAITVTAESLSRIRGTNAGSTAAGIWSGEGDDTITNTGTITVLADAHATAASSEAAATGIRTLEGDDVVVNDGELTVTADAYARLGGDFAVAIGIMTDEGDDTIINEGVLVTRRLFAGADVWDIAIDAGEGNDSVVLGSNSETRGDIEMGAGDDALTIHGGAVHSGVVSGGKDADTLELLGAETSVIGQVSSMEHLDLGGGHLEVSDPNGVTLDSSMVLETTINHEGGAGMLQAQSIEAGGTLVVNAGEWSYIDGSSYRIIASNLMTDAFDELVMPESTAFLDFKLLGDLLGMKVRVAVESFESAATSAVEMEVAAVLDASLPDAQGDMAHLIGSFQLTSAAQVNQAFASLAPGIYDALSRTSADAARTQSAGLQYRLDTARMSIDDSARGLGLWGQLQGGWGDVDHDDAYAGYSNGGGGIAVGADVLRERYLYGGALGYVATDVDEDFALSSGDVGSLFISGYGGFLFGKAFVQSGLSLGRGSYEARRNVTVGALQRQASGDYDGTTVSWAFKGGYGFDLGDWKLEPYGLLDWVRTEEDAVTESGAGAANLLVDDRTNNRLFTELGARIFGNFTGQSGRLRPEFLLAWSHAAETDDGDIIAAFAGAPDIPFTVPGRAVDSNGAVLGAGFVYFGKSDWSAGIRLNGEWRDNARSYGLLAQFHHRF